MNFVSEYIKYLLIAKGRHGIHSPFVYDFVDKCLSKTVDPKFSTAIAALKYQLATNYSKIDVNDAGAGSKKLGKSRSIESIFKTASCKGTYAHLLYQIVAHYQPKRIVELGTSLGIGTIYLAAGNNENSEVTSIDACKNTQDVAAQNLRKMNFTNVHLVNDTFDSFLDDQIENPGEKFDLVYIDGHHNGEALKNYMQKLSKLTDENTIFVIDDIRWSKDMHEAWKFISNAEEFHLSIDLFRMGIVIRRPQQVKEHFVIKLKNVLSGF